MTRDVGQERRDVLAPLPCDAGPSGKTWYMAEVDRFLVPEKDKVVTRFFLDHLFIPHNRLERLHLALARRSPAWFAKKRLFGRCWLILFGDGHGPPLLLPRGPSNGYAGEARTTVAELFSSSSALETVSRISRELLPEILGSKATSLDWIIRRDHPSSKRRRLVAFLLRDGEPGPFAVLKLQSALTGQTLQREWNALRYLGTCLPKELLSALPHPLHHERLGSFEVLLTSYLPGRSMDVEMGRRPVSRSTLARHMIDGVVWLACFHRTTESRGRKVDLERETAAVLEALSSTPEGIDPERARFWIEPLNRRHLRIPICACHGDFGTWNLIVRRRRRSMGGPMLDISGVVDWDSFSADADPFTDLFHFALTYGLDYPWTPYQKRPPEEAFRLAFLDESPVSDAIRSAFSVYCDLTGTPREALRPLFHLFLLRRWVETRGSAMEGDWWLTFHRLSSNAPARAFDE